MTDVGDRAPAASLLSSREQEILLGIAAGLSAKQIARSLLLSHRTVERHIENIRVKMQARNTAHLITRAFAVGALSAA
jgi:LuxR family transcriptional regulator of spore coat protein